MDKPVNAGSKLAPQRSPAADPPSDPAESIGGDLPPGFSRARGLFAVERPAVPVVLDRKSGRYERHADVIGDDWPRAVQMRLESRSSADRFLCAECFRPVYLVCWEKTHRLHFRHKGGDGDCSAVTSGQLSQEAIDARRYNGQKESWLHQEMKTWLQRSMHADGRFTGVHAERRWCDTVTGEWRRPDVQAVYRGLRVVFEVQLSSTYINVIAQRREFYLREGGLLFWIFADFAAGVRRLTQDDVFYNNNRNAFVVSPRSVAASEAQKRFLLECVWAEPLPGGGVSPLQRALVPFDELALDVETQRAYHFDFDGRRAELERDLVRRQRELAERRRERLESLRSRFEAFYGAWHDNGSFDSGAWRALRKDFASEGVSLPAEPSYLPAALLNSLYSAKHGRVVHWKYNNFIEVAHYVADRRKHLLHFRKALLAYDRAALLQQQDRSGSWREKVKAYKARIAAGDPTYAPDERHDALIALLFPEVAAVELP
ncbi:DUF6035 family protein [Rubrivivax gelatinosus]|uniref:DUF6035 family protein n=1 Tax=Rubrivivax gelatinosus TaxID=28068 RepID=UPI0012FD8821|nr:DUF6035 family protein [Rubrivivax gelatinosus]MBG6083200.1 hypothetical protein [Rubrivivax gelatinosus]